MLLHQRTEIFSILIISLTCLLPSCGFAQSQSESDIDEVNTSELNVDAVEPQISLPEIARDPSRRLRVQSISLGQRLESRDGLVRIAQEAVNTTSRRLLSSDQHTPWQMMHALLGLRQEFHILHQQQEVNGLEWMAQGQFFNGDAWFEKTQYGGRAHPYSVPYAFEGHANQMLAVLSMCGLEKDHQFQTATGPISIADMVEHAKATCDTKKDEPTWTLWALSRYLPPDAVWRNQNGDVCSIELLVADQTKRPLKGAACGGTHGLFALAHARNVYLQEGKPLRGVWLQAENKLRYYINTARRLQNPNGTLSSNYLRTRTYSPDFNKRMASSGHVLEFLMLALPQRELNQRWVRRAIETTARDLLNNRKEYVKCSPLYHSVNALNIYLDRVNPRQAVPQTEKAEPARTAMLNRPDPGRRIRARGISQGRVLDDKNESAGTLQTQPSQTQPVEVAETSNVAQQPEAQQPETVEPENVESETAIADSSQATHTALPTTSSANEAIAKQSPPKQGELSDMPMTGPIGATAKRRIKQSATEAIIQKQLDELNHQAAEDHWKATNTDRAEYRDNQSTKPESDDTDDTGTIPASDTPANPEKPTRDDATADVIPSDNQGTLETDGVIALKPVDPKSTLQEVVGPESAVEIEASEKAELLIPNPPSLPAKSSPSEPVKSDRPLLRRRLHTGRSRPTLTLSDGPVERMPLTIPSRTISQSRTLAREAASTDSEESKADETKKDPKPAEDSSQPEKETKTSRAINPTEFRTVPAGINDQFLALGLDAQEWVNRFEVESREIYAQRNEILNAVALSDGESIADIGAGTGLFTELFSDAVGTAGEVYAIDISPRLVTYLEQRVTNGHLDNVTVVRNDSFSTQLLNRKVDKAFVCDTYHHFEHPDAMLKSIHRALNQGGELVVVDFERIIGKSRAWVMGHVRAGKETFRAEIEASGFHFVKEVKIDGLNENYLLVFRKQ